MVKNNLLQLSDGFIFDYSTMLGEGRLSLEDITAMQDLTEKAVEAVEVMRNTGFAKSHLSKDGTPEPVYFLRLPFVKEDNPNNPKSISKLAELSEYVRDEIDAVVFLGIGGSYLGNKVLFDVFCGETWNCLSNDERHKRPYVFFAGNNLDPLQNLNLRTLLRNIGKHGEKKGSMFKVLLVPISKSGTTLETLTAFSYYYDKCINSDVVKTEVAVVTGLDDKTNSPLYRLAKQNGWRYFDVKDGIGGRFSILHDVGLVTAAVLGLDIEAILDGAKAMDTACRTSNLWENPALLNATLKYLAAAKCGCDIEVFMGYGMCLKSVSEWYVQLLAESLGKRHDRNGNTVFYGRTPIAAVGSTDMHAQTQQHQDGRRNKVVQFLYVESFSKDIVLGNPFPDIPEFAKYYGLSMQKALKTAMNANREALDSDNRFSALYSLPVLDEFHVGQLLYFLMLSIAYEGELANVDAFDQPGVEAYKRIMKRELSR